VVRISILLAFTVLSLQAVAEPVIYYCTLLTRLPGAEESPVFRFEVDGATAVLTYTFRPRPEETPQDFELHLRVLNDSERSLVLGMLTEGNEQHPPRYDVWVLDKHDMHLSSEVTRASEAGTSRLELRSGTCVIQE